MGFNQQKLILTIAALLPSEEIAIKIQNSNDTYSDEGDRLWSELFSAIASIGNDSEAGPRALSLLLDLGRMYGENDAQLRDELLHLREKFAKQRQIKCDVAPEDMTDDQILNLVGAMFDCNEIGVIGRINNNGADWYECPLRLLSPNNDQGIVANRYVIYVTP